MRSRRLRLDGWIAGVGTASGVRIVTGHWLSSPFGPFSDVMIEQARGERLLLVPTRRIADFIAGIYTFDRVRIVPVTVTVRPTDTGVGAGAAAQDGTDTAGAARATARPATWTITAGPLHLQFATGRRGPLGWLLRAVPEPLAASPAWTALTDLLARPLPGVRTRGSAGRGCREWYGARDLQPIAAATATFDGDALGPLAPVDPPVRFGFGSTPRRPALVRVTTTVETAPQTSPSSRRHGTPPR